MEKLLFERTRCFWGNMVQQGNLIYPNEHVIRFIKGYFKNASSTTILDFGCGGGRNTVALATEGYRVIAMDYTDTAIEMTTEKCRLIPDIDVTVLQNVNLEVPIDADSVDAVVADGSLFYNEKERITEIVSNLKKAMKKNALLWADFRKADDSLYGKGREIAKGLFELGEGTGREGCTYYFAEESDIRDIFGGAGLELVSIDDFKYSVNNHSLIESWFHVVARK